MLIFQELPITEEVKKAIAEMGFSEATPIQSEALLPILEGHDVMAQAPTGTGKTCAFGIPLIESANPDNTNIEALILCPTRELVIQTAEELEKLARYKKGIRISAIYGGQPIERQLTDLKKKPQIIVATPGRMMDHLRRRSIRLQELSCLVLDEADEMLNMGFRDDIETILETAPSHRQTVLFSATIPEEIKEISKQFQKKNRQHIKVTPKILTVPTVEQYYLEVKGPKKLDALSRMLDLYGYKLCLVFCNTKKKTDEVTEALIQLGYAAEALHGDMKQPERDRVMNRFRNGNISVLVATDIAARGIDIDDVEAVFNFDVPQFEEYYVHRIGRTGRANKKGVAYTFVAGKEMFKLKEITSYTKAKILPMKTPTEETVLSARARKTFQKAVTVFREQNMEPWLDAVSELLSEGKLNASELAAALLSMNAKEKAPVKKVKEEREISKKTGAEKGMARLFISLGSLDKIRPRHIIELVSSNTPVSGGDVGAVDIFDKYSFFEVPADKAELVIEALRELSYRGRTIFIEEAAASLKQKNPKNKNAGEKKAVNKRKFHK